MQNYLEKYKGSVNKPNNDFEEKSSKKKKKKQNIVIDPVNFEDSEYLPVIVNVEEERKLEAEKQRYELLNSKKNEIEAGWKIVKDETQETQQKKLRNDSPEPPKIETKSRMNRFDSPESKIEKDLSPQRKNQEDLSPPRRKRRRTTPSPERSQKEDLSPPRRRKSPSPKNQGDLSPPRRRRVSTSPSPERISKDLSPPRKNRDGDLSPRKRLGSPSPQISSTSKQEISGLQHPNQLKSLIDQNKEKEITNISKLPYDVTGQFAETIFRDREGKIITREQFLEMKRKEREKKEVKIQKEFEWGKGIVQKQEKISEEEAIMNEMSKPFSRYEGKDEEIEDELKKFIREGDPMSNFLKKKDKKGKKKSKDFSMNRYGIPPGKKWDGVDRSNGFEKKLLQMKNQKEIEKRKDYQDM